MVQPGNGRLVVVKQAAPISVEAQRRTTIKVHVHAVAGGIVPVTARILTPDGLQMGKTVDRAGARAADRHLGVLGARRRGRPDLPDRAVPHPAPRPGPPAPLAPEVEEL